MIPHSRSNLLLLIALVSFGAVGIALISQHVYDYPPCAWCVFQRLIYVVIGVVALAGALLPKLGRAAALLSGILGVGGVVSAWYQHAVAAEMVSCDRTFADQFMVKSGLDGALPSVFGIFATCMDAKVQVLGVEYAIWSLMLFIVLIALSIVAWRRASPLVA